MKRALRVAVALVAGCSPARSGPSDSRASDVHPADAAAPAVSGARASASAPPGAAVSPVSSVSPVDAGAPDATAAAGEGVAVESRVKIVTIGMHVAGGPFDEPTKEPFKKAVEPSFPQMAKCWAKQVPHPPKTADVGVDLLIEPGGGPPKVSNPRSTLPGLGKAVANETEGFVPCVMSVFEAVSFPNLAPRGRTGVSYSLRFTAR